MDQLRASFPVEALHARIDQVTAVLDAAPAGPRTSIDLDSFHGRVADVRAAIGALRPP